MSGVGVWVCVRSEGCRCVSLRCECSGMNARCVSRYCVGCDVCGCEMPY